MYYETCPFCYKFALHYQVFRGIDKYGKYIEYCCNKCGGDFRVHVHDKNNPKAKVGERDRYRYLKAGTGCKKKDRW